MLIGITAFTLAAVVEQRNFANRRYLLEEAERLRTEKQKLLLLERERVTREMHDGLGGQLVSVLAMVERGLAAPGEVAESIRRAIDDIRIVIDSLDPATTDLPASLGGLRARLDPLLRRNGITLSWHVDDHLRPDALAPEGVLHVLRIIQEAVTNTLRHADASIVEVAITLDDDENRSLRIKIRDDGHGFPVNAATGNRGINNMRFRAKELGTELRIENTDSGTQVDLTLPLAN
jgi:signal transduction histidine kinase